MKFNGNREKTIINRFYKKKNMTDGWRAHVKAWS